jgi:hypothetical protein
MEVTKETATTFSSPFTSLAVSPVTDSVMQTYAQQAYTFMDHRKHKFEVVLEIRFVTIFPGSFA